jgi:hypothetical protein
VAIADFQRALCDMTLDPVLAAAVLRRGAHALSGYILTDIEQGRLIAVVRQPGMSVNCTLARANRFAPIADAFPLTCSLLKPWLRPLLDELWSVHRPGNYQFAGEATAFSSFLQQKLSQGDVKHPYAEEIFRYECAAWDLVQTLRSSVPGRPPEDEPEKSVTVRFAHDPHALVPALERDETPPPDLPAGDYVVRLTLRNDVLDVQTVEVLART